MKWMNKLAALSGLVAMLAGCSMGPADGSGAAVIDEPEPTQAAEPDTQGESEPVSAADSGAESDADDEAAFGTRTNPLPLGTTIEMADWSLAVTEVTLDANEQVLAANQFNDPPVPGRQFVMFRVEATYEGDDSGEPWLDFSWAIVGSGGNTFASGNDDSCGVIPDPFSDGGETYPGGSVVGNVCFAVESDQVTGATIRVEESFSFDDTRAFFALE